MLAVVTLSFDPAASVLGISLRLETLALAGAIFVALVLTALGAGRSRLAIAASEGVTSTAGPTLRRDDLILIGFGAVPGAVIGGRLGYALIHLDYYSTNANALLDPGQGGLALTLAVLLGTLTAVAVAGLLAAPIGRWLGVAAVPLLIGLGLGKLAMVLGGAGQGSYSDASWATSYAGPGPWNSTNPSLGAIPSQALEGGLVLALAALVLVVPFVLRIRIWHSHVLVRPGLAPHREWAVLAGGRRYLTAIGLWAVLRFAVEFTWRDAHVLGPFTADQLVLLPIAVGCFFGPLAVTAVGRVKAGAATRLAELRAERSRRAAEAAEAAEAARVAAVQAAEAAEAARVTEAERAAAEAAEAARIAEEARVAEAQRAAAEADWAAAEAAEAARLAAAARVAEAERVAAGAGEAARVAAARLVAEAERIAAEAAQAERAATDAVEAAEEAGEAAAPAHLEDAAAPSEDPESVVEANPAEESAVADPTGPDGVTSDAVVAKATQTKGRAATARATA